MVTDSRQRRYSVTAYAPGRICLAGEGLDWMAGGSSVVAAIDIRTKVSFLPPEPAGHILFSSREPLFIKRSVGLAELAAYAGDELDLLQAIANLAAQRLPGFGSGTLRITTQLPVAAGLASSAAVTLAAYTALANAHGVRPGRGEICTVAYAAENVELRIGSGWMDFLGCAYGSVSKIDSSASSPSRRLLASGLGASIILIDTGGRRSTREVLASHRERLVKGDTDILAYIAGTAAVVDRLAIALKESELDHSVAGPLIQEAQALLRDRLRCSTPVVNRVVDLSMAAGAYAAKQVGERGSYVFVLAPPSGVPGLLKALERLPVRIRMTTVDNLGLYFDHSTA